MAIDHTHIFRLSAFVLFFLLTALPWVTSPVALVAGFAFSLLLDNPFPELTARLSKHLLKLSVIGLGFGVNLAEVIEVGKSALVTTLLSIAATLLLGEILGRVLRVPDTPRCLIAFGTAICGGSAIAAMAPVLRAKSEEIAVALSTVFTLNAVALLLFPPIGRLCGLDQNQFGLWAALAIHDTSSVVGAAATYGVLALSIATTVKLARALWIVPCTLLAAAFLKSDAKAPLPLFILCFIAAAFINSSLPDQAALWQGLQAAAKQALVMTLFLIGAGLTRQVLKQVGIRALLLGLLLWVVVSTTSLILVSTGLLS